MGSNVDPKNELDAKDARKRLTIRTTGLEGDYPLVSMLPTPVANNRVSWGSQQHMPSIPNNSVRNASSSLIPDSPSTLHTNLSSPTDQRVLPSPAITLGRADSLIVPKRRTKSQQLGRSLSVGGPQRLPSTILHREPKVGTIIETLPADVYVAVNKSDKQTAWTRVKVAGKGSFSEVVLAKPALEFIKPELVDKVAEATNAELQVLGQDNEGGGDNHETVSAQEDNAASATNTGGNSNFNANVGFGRSVLVAVKVTALNHSRADSELQLFKRDLAIMNSIPHHPSLMRLIGWSLDEQIHKRALFILPYCCGGDLFDLVARHRSKLSCMLIRRLFADVCSAVVFLHSNLIVHRDIKLENVLLDLRVVDLLNMAHPNLYSGPLSVLTDLGLARKIDLENPMLTTRCGSDDYVPPEIMLGQPYDGRETDSWALGVLLYAMLEGRLPFDPPPNMAQHEGNRARLRVAHRIARVDWVWYKRNEVSEEWKGGKEVVEGCLKRRSNRRLARDILQMPWVKDAIGPVIHESHDAQDEIWKLFVQ